MDKRKNKKMMTFCGRKTEEYQNSATTMTSVDGEGSFSPVKLKLKGESFE